MRVTTAATLLGLTLGLAPACSTNSPNPGGSEPAPRAAGADPRAAASGEAGEQAGAGVSGGRPAAPDEPATVEAVDETDGWRPCRTSVVDSVRAAPVVIAGELTTVGERIDGGAVTAAVPGLAASSAGTGQWVCRGDDPAEVEFRARLFGADFGPRWTLAATSDGPEPPRPQPINLLAEAVEGRWSGTLADAEAAVSALEACESPTGGSLRSGVFISMVMDPDGVDALAPIEWSVFPEVRRADGAGYRISVHWRTKRGDRLASFLAVPRVRGCLPFNELGEGVLETMAAVPATRVAFGPPGEPARPPSSTDNLTWRATSYLQAHGAELAAFADWIAMVQRIQPYTPGAWSISEPDIHGIVTLQYSFGLGDEQHSVTWTVEARTGVVTPVSDNAVLARAAGPRYRPGFDARAAYALPPTVPPTVFDAAVNAKANDILACAPAAHRVALDYQIGWDGVVAYAAVAEADVVVSDAELTCMRRVLTSLGLPPFSGERISRITTFSR